MKKVKYIINNHMRLKLFYFRCSRVMMMMMMMRRRRRRRVWIIAMRMRR